MRQEVPDFAQVLPGRGRQPARAGQVQREARHHHGNHPGCADALLCHDIGQIGQPDRNRNLRHFPALDDGHDPDGDARRKPAGQRTAEDQQGEPGQRLAQGRIRHTQHDKPHEQPEQRNGRCIVQQAFALDDPRQTARGRDRAKDAHDRRRVGCRHNRADQKARNKGQRADPTQRIAHRQSGRHDGNHSHHQDRHPVIQHPAQVHPQRRLKQQRRQEHIKEHVGLDRQTEDRNGHRVQGIRQVRPQKKDGPKPDQDAQHSKNNAERQAHAGRQRLGHPDHDKQGCNDGCNNDNIHHSSLTEVVPNGHDTKCSIPVFYNGFLPFGRERARGADRPDSPADEGPARLAAGHSESLFYHARTRSARSPKYRW